jgi:hypothetical protein
MMSLNLACPKCGSARVHHSRRRGTLEHLLALVGARVQRCHACRVRFVRVLRSTIYMDEARRSLRNSWRLCLVLAGTLLVLIILLWLVNRQSAVLPE